MKISATVITFNEEDNIKRCLNSLQAVVDEIIVVDSFSQDQTVEIAKGLANKVIQNPFVGHIEQKNFAVEQASFDYILSLDADEALSEELRESILKVKQKASPAQAYAFNRRNQYCGRWVYHGGWYPDRRIRLWNKNAGQWGGVNPHDIVTLSEQADPYQLKGDLLHYTYKSIAEHIAQANKFSDIASKEAYKKGKKVLLIEIILNPLYTFIQKYFLKMGFLDGERGLIICTLSAYSNFLKYSKLRMLHEKKDHS